MWSMLTAPLGAWATCGFTSDWLRKWREIFKPINKRSNAKPKQTQFTLDTQVKTALYEKQKLLPSSF